MSELTRSEIAAILKQRKWTVASLADRWGFSRRYVTARIANEDRGQLWDDAFRGLPMGEGFYRRRAVGDNPAGDLQSVLQIGSLVASEAEMDTFGYGSRGVVVEVISKHEWKVIWDGGTLMSIDSDCLNDWVVDLGLRVADANKWAGMPLALRIATAEMYDLYS